MFLFNTQNGRIMKGATKPVCKRCNSVSHLLSNEHSRFSPLPAAKGAESYEPRPLGYLFAYITGFLLYLLHRLPIVSYATIYFLIFSSHTQRNSLHFPCPEKYFVKGVCLLSWYYFVTSFLPEFPRDCRDKNQTPKDE